MNKCTPINNISSVDQNYEIELANPLPKMDTDLQMRDENRINNIEAICWTWDVQAEPGELREVYFDRHPYSYSQATAKMECATRAYCSLCDYVAKNISYSVTEAEKFLVELHLLLDYTRRQGDWKRDLFGAQRYRMFLNPQDNLRSPIPETEPYIHAITRGDANGEIINMVMRLFVLRGFLRLFPALADMDLRPVWQWISNDLVNTRRRYRFWDTSNFVEEIQQRLFLEVPNAPKVIAG